MSLEAYDPVTGKWVILAGWQPRGESTFFDDLDDDFDDIAEESGG